MCSRSDWGPEDLVWRWGGEDGGKMGREDGGWGGEESREMMVFWQKEKVRYFHFIIVKVCHFCCATIFPPLTLGLVTSFLLSFKHAHVTAESLATLF